MTPKNGNGLFCKLKKYWFVIVFIFGLGVWVATVELSAAAGKAKDESQDKRVEKQDGVIEQIAANQDKLVALQERMAGQLDVIILLLGIKVTDSQIQRWQQVPKSLPLKDGAPVGGSEWLSVSPDYLYGRTFKWINDDSMLVRVEWDERAQEEQP